MSCERCAQLRDRHGTLLLERVRIPTSFFARARGLLGRDRVEPEEGMLLTRCNAIHMFWMRTSIDVVFLGPRCEILRIVERLRPWRIAACREAASVLEIAPGTARRLNLRIGDRLTICA